MLSLLITVLVALAPEPKLSEADDFNEMVVRVESEIGCEAHRLMKAEPDDARAVLFHCKDGTDALVVFVLRQLGDWVIIPRQFKHAPAKVEVLGI